MIDFDQIKREAGLTGGDTNYPTDLGSLISTILKIAFPAAGIILLLLLLAGGFSLMTSSGDPKKMQAAKGQITSAVIGFVIVFASYWITQIAGLILGLDDFKSIFQ